MNLRILIPALVLLLPMLSQCRNDAPNTDPAAIDIDRFILVYCEYLDHTSRDTSRWENRSKVLTGALEKHELSREEFDRTLLALESRPEELEPIILEIESRLRALMDAGRGPD
jgi:hypothetical protein